MTCIWKLVIHSEGTWLLIKYFWLRVGSSTFSTCLVLENADWDLNKEKTWQTVACPGSFQWFTPACLPEDCSGSQTPHKAWVTHEVCVWYPGNVRSSFQEFRTLQLLLKGCSVKCFSKRSSKFPLLCRNRKNHWLRKRREQSEWSFGTCSWYMASAPACRSVYIF